MEHTTVIIIGSGHLAYRVKKLAEHKQHTVIHLTDSIFQTRNEDGSVLNRLSEVLKDIHLDTIAMVYVLNDRDDYNLEVLLALMSLNNTIGITLTLFNENIAPHLLAAHPNLKIYNPAKIAAPVFVEALNTPIERSLHYSPIKKLDEFKHISHTDKLTRTLLILFGAVIALTTAYFHFFDNLSWLNSLYFVIVTVATVGYGDINLLNASSMSKIVAIGLILSSTFFIWMIFSLTIDRIIKKRVQLALGRKQYHYKNHVILCGLGKLGYFIAEELLRRGEKFIIVESKEDSPNIEYFRNKGIDIYIGNASYPDVLRSVGVTESKAVISVINNDYVNLEIGLNARSFNPNLRLILRIFDEAMAEKIKENLDINLTLSMSAVADEKIFRG